MLCIGECVQEKRLIHAEHPRATVVSWTSPGPRGTGWVCAGAGQGDGHCSATLACPQVTLPLGQNRGCQTLRREFSDTRGTNPSPPPYPSGNEPEGPRLGSVSAALRTDRWPW